MLRSAPLLALLLAASCQAGRFACEQDDECRGDAGQGMCAPGGVCSFPDEACPSGQRYGSHGGALSGDCVPVADATTGSTSVASSDTFDPSDPSVGPLSSTTSSSSPTDATQSTSGEVSSSGDSIGPSNDEPLIWLRFEADAPTHNSGVLGGEAICASGCPDTFDGVAYMNGSSDCLRFASEEALQHGPLSAAVWVWPNANAEPNALVGKFFGDVEHSWEVHFQGLGAFGTVVATMDGLPPATVQAEGLPANAWTHVALTWTEADLQLYINGQPAAAVASGQTLFDDNPIRIGCDTQSGSETDFIDGALADVRVYDRALNEGEVAELAAAVPPTPD